MAEELFRIPTEPPVAVELRTLVQRAQAGDAGALPRIRQILEAHPEVWQTVGDLAALTERAWITVLAADNPLGIESLKRTIAAMKADLAGEHPTPLERLLIGQVVSTWMELKYVESTSADPGHGSLEQAAFRLKRLESAQKRFDQAVKTLTSVRTLLPAGLAPAGAIKVFEEKRALA
jgi:hypothetical protein